MKVLIFAIDVMPGRGRRTSGGSLRTAQIAGHFARHGSEVVVSQPRDARLVRLQMRTLTDSEAACLYHAGNQLEIIRATKPDVIIWGWPLVAQVPIKADRHVTSVVDLNGFQNIEGSSFGGTAKADATRTLLERAAKADHIIYGSSEQKCYWTGIADLAGIPLLGRGWILPFYYCCGYERLYKLGAPDFHYAGSLLPWVKTQPLLKELARQLELSKKGQLRLVTHSEPASPNHATVADFLSNLRTSPRVQIGAPCGADELFAEIAFSGIGLDLSQYSFEREFAIPIRTISYLAHGIPVIINEYSKIAKDIAENEAGWAFPIEPDRFAQAIGALLDELSPAEAERRSRRAAQFARSAFALVSVRGLRESFESVSESHLNRLDEV